MDAVTVPPIPINEPVHSYRRDTPERLSLEAKLGEFAGQSIDLTMTIGGQQRMAAGGRIDVVAPHSHS
ncbi:MAG TPA: 1-pyrroline-5-carboxylate dehydrogenase, partial [Jatrophihabitantaceae bacterium]|nr:1-pyrroline-5-carboxylate dehydrogenase [Jatrophihabitantaceae bacterium]